MYLRLEKIDLPNNRLRWYVLSIQPTLFGEWALIREWGRIGNEGGQVEESYYSSEDDARGDCNRIKSAKLKRGYTVQAEQLELLLWG